MVSDFPVWGVMPMLPLIAKTGTAPLVIDLPTGGVTMMSSPTLTSGVSPVVCDSPKSGVTPMLCSMLSDGVSGLVTLWPSCGVTITPPSVETWGANPHRLASSYRGRYADIAIDRNLWCDSD